MEIINNEFINQGITSYSKFFVGFGFNVVNKPIKFGLSVNQSSMDKKDIWIEIMFGYWRVII